MTPVERSQVLAWAAYHDAECSAMQACCTMSTHLATDAIRRLVADLDALTRQCPVAGHDKPCDACPECMAHWRERAETAEHELAMALEREEARRASRA